MGKLRKRMSFSRINEGLEMPDLIEVQKRSYQRFLETDLKEVLADASPITNYNGNLELTFTDYSLGEPKNSVERCRERDMTYAAPLNIHVHLYDSETSEIKETDVYMGDFPLMTENGTFVINGADRVIVSQLFVRRAAIIPARWTKRVCRSTPARLSPTAARGWNMRRTPMTSSGFALTAPASSA